MAIFELGSPMLVATSNAGKLRDFAAAAGVFGVEIRAMAGLDAIPAPAEDAVTFEGNARAKAEYYSGFAPGEWVLADDSGLEVDSLEGRPGVRSARFAEDLGALDARTGVDASNNEVLLLAMLEQTDRVARYRCVLALAQDGKVFRTSAGSVEGEVLSEERGAGGFGYDPLFYVPELGCTMAEASPEQRMRVSHRARALRALIESLR